ncbi:17beta-estradiol 17-dehydrogenase [Microdochium nivale]|nr:17beta-estradiol 17-dehydrogenase [Microdochium nivale]
MFGLPAVFILPCALGTAAIAAFAYKAIRFLTFHAWTSSQPLQRYLGTSSEPSWAFITGSSAGIGFGFAHALVKAGFSVIIHSHRLDELETAARELRSLRSGAKVEILHFNAMGFVPEELEKSLGKISKLPISVLINNVGAAPGAFKDVAACSPVEIDTSLDVNVRFVTHITKLLLPTLSSQPRALIVNLSSGSRVGLPYLSVYGSSKAYMDTFSHVLDREARVMGHNIRSISIPPGDVKTQANHIGPFPAGTPIAQDFARNAVCKMDTAIDRGMLRMQPDWIHDLQVASMTWLPEAVWSQSAADSILAKKTLHDEHMAKSR